MTDKETIIELVPGQILDIRTPRGMRVTYPEGKQNPKRILTRDLGTWVEPVPPEPPPTQPAFGSRPASGLIVRDGGSSQTVENVTVTGGGVSTPAGVAITIRNVTGSVVIRDVDLVNLSGGIYLYNCQGTVSITNVRSRNIGTGVIGSGNGNHIVLAESSMSGSISGNQFLGGRTEDMLSTWHAGGRGAGQELIWENNRIQGLVADTATARAWVSGSGTGIIVGDGSGHARNGYVIVRNNTFLTPGQLGIQHIDGPGLQTYGNVIYGEQRPGNNQPFGSWEGHPVGVVRDNRYWWTREDGTHPDGWFHPGSGMTAINNIADQNIDPASLVVTL